MNIKDCCIDRFNGCCCTCVYHLEDYENCTTNQSLRNKKNVCICNIQKGYICYAYIDGMGRAHSNWGEHGMCELHEKKKEVKS